MQSNVTFRNKRKNESSNDTNRSLQFTRPKSWGEFQSSLKTFQKIQRPKTSAKSAVPEKQVVENSQVLINGSTGESKATGTGTSNVILRRKNSSEDVENEVRPRPFSEVIAPPSFIKFSAPQPLPLLKVANGKSDSSAENIKNLTVEAVDVPSLEFETALENTSCVSENAETSIDPKASAFNRKNIPLENDTLNVQQPKGSDQSLSYISNDDDILCKQIYYQDEEKVNNNGNIYKPKLSEQESEKRSPKHSSLSRDSNATSAESLLEALEQASEETLKTAKTDSEISSAIDTGFHSFGETGNSQVSAEANDLSSDQEESEMKSNEKIKSSVQMRKVIPTPFRSCYVNPYDLHSDQRYSRDSSMLSKSSNSSMSATLSEDEINSDLLHRENVSFGSESDASSSTYRKKNARLGTAVYTASAEFKFKSFESHRAKNRVKTLNESNWDTAGNGSYFKLDATKSKTTAKNLQDDLDATTVNNVSNQVTKPSRSHGTWPRQSNRSKRRRSQAEADELLRNFRETSEIYRTRFKAIYAETRRKIEETMFGLRVAVAKSGYSSKYYAMTKPQRS